MFSEKERSIFKYFNGKKEVFGDPIAIHRRLLTCDNFDLAGDFKLVDALSKPIAQKSPGFAKEGLQAFDRLVSACRKAFKLPAFDEETGEGLVEEEIIQLFAEFGLFVDEIKKKQEPSVTSVSCTEQELPNGEVSQSTMKPSADSITTPEEVSLVEV